MYHYFLYWFPWTGKVFLVYPSSRRGKDRNPRPEDNTWQNRQPGRVLRNPNGISSYTSIFPSILKRNISDIQDFYLFICNVNTGSLEEKDGKKEKKAIPHEKRKHVECAPEMSQALERHVNLWGSPLLSTKTFSKRPNTPRVTMKIFWEHRLQINAHCPSPEITTSYACNANHRSWKKI